MSLRRKAKRMLRWQRWEDKVMGVVGPDMVASPGALRAFRAYAREWNRRHR